MRRIMLLLTMLVGACSSDPKYPPPSDEEARAAYARAIRADLIDSPPRHSAEGSTEWEAGDRPDEAAAKMGRAFNAEAENSARLNASRTLESLSKVTIGECSWGSIDPDDIRPHGRERVEGKVGEGYTCDYQVFHDTETRGPVSARGTGYFFQRDGSYDFAGVEEGTFEKVGS